MTLFTLYVEKSLANGDVYWETMDRGVSLQKAERRRRELERLGKRCAIQKYRAEILN